MLHENIFTPTGMRRAVRECERCRRIVASPARTVLRPSVRRQVHTSARTLATPKGASTSNTTSSKDSSPAYPFSSAVLTRTKPTLTPDHYPHVPRRPSMRRTVLPLVHLDLRSQYDPNGRLTKLFSRKHPECIPVGSVITVEQWTSATSKTSFSSFSGVLLAVKRRGTATSFLVRNLIAKLGVEQRFMLYSPLLKDIKVVQRADVGKGEAKRRGGLRRARRAKLYYLRRDNARLAGIGNVVKRMKEEENRAAGQKGGRGTGKVRTR